MSHISSIYSIQSVQCATVPQLMLPPRLIRPPRPRRTPWSILQARWGSGGPRDALSTRRADAPQSPKARGRLASNKQQLQQSRGNVRLLQKSGDGPSQAPMSRGKAAYRHLYWGALKLYRSSVAAAGAIIPEIHSMSSPRLAPILTKAVDRLVILTEEAATDRTIRTTIERYLTVDPKETREWVTKSHASTPSMTTDSQPLPQQIHAQSRSMKSSHHPSSHGKTTGTDRAGGQSLLEELFPESTNYTQPHYTQRDPYPKLDLPSSQPASPKQYSKPISRSKRLAQALQSRGEQITVLQLVHCSAELTEHDFRRLVPGGKHIETWARGGEFYKLIPGRDPLSLERLPFYYLLFKRPEFALAYQKNASRLHKLSTLHQPTDIHSVIPPPKNFLEDGEDINAATSSYLLKPTSAMLGLNVVMQPYNHALRAVIEEGGYRPIVPSTTSSGEPLWKVLLCIEGYEPSQDDLYYAFQRHGYDIGIQWPFYNDHHAIHRLRDLANLKARLQPTSSANPRAANSEKSSLVRIKSDIGLGNDSFMGFEASSQTGDSHSTTTAATAAEAMELHQIVMNKVYNRWIVDFTDEDAARRFARLWHRRTLRSHQRNETWRDAAEARTVNAEFLW